MTTTTPVPPGGRSLVGRHVRLDPSTDADADELFTALDDNDVWAGGYADGRVVGTSSLGGTVLAHGRTHLGWTAYAPDVWGGVVNPECKLLLLTHAFEECGFGRVKIQTDAINLRSQAAIVKLGAVREGVLRRHMLRPDGTTRDTVVFSVTIEDWPNIRGGLSAHVGG